MAQRTQWPDVIGPLPCGVCKHVTRRLLLHVLGTVYACENCGARVTLTVEQLKAVEKELRK